MAMGQNWQQNPYGGSYAFYPGSYYYPTAPIGWQQPLAPTRPTQDQYYRHAQSLQEPKAPAEKKSPWYVTAAKEVLKTGVIVGASVLGGIFLGVPGAVAAGAAASGAVSAIDQKVSKGKIDWGSVAIDTALGAIPGGVGSTVVRTGEKILLKRAGVTLAEQGLKRAAVVGSVDGALLGYAGGGAHSAYDSYQKTGQVDLGQANRDGLSGLLPGAIGGAIAGGAFTALGRRLQKSSSQDSGKESGKKVERSTSSESLSSPDELRPPKRTWGNRLMAMFLPKSESAELANFHEVIPPDQARQSGTRFKEGTIFRGAMPESTEAFGHLKTKYNVDTIIDLRGEGTTKDQYIDFEKHWAEKTGIKHVNIKMDSTRAPSTEELHRFFWAVEEARQRGGTVYVHCKHGVDRTGSMIAAYQVAYQNVEPRAAYRLMQRYGYNWQHEWTRPEQRQFVTDGGLKPTVDHVKAGIELRKHAQALREANTLSGEQHDQVVTLLMQGKNEQARKLLGVSSKEVAPKKEDEREPLGGGGDSQSHPKTTRTDQRSSGRKAPSKTPHKGHAKKEESHGAQGGFGHLRRQTTVDPRRHSTQPLPKKNEKPHGMSHDRPSGEMGTTGTLIGPDLLHQQSEKPVAKKGNEHSSGPLPLSRDGEDLPSSQSTEPRTDSHSQSAPTKKDSVVPPTKKPTLHNTSGHDLPTGNQTDGDRFTRTQAPKPLPKPSTLQIKPSGQLEDPHSQVPSSESSKVRKDEPVHHDDVLPPRPIDMHTQLFGDNLRAVQFKQEGFQDCYLLANLRSIFSHPQAKEIIRQIHIEKTSFNNEEAYKVTFPAIAQQTGEPKSVVIPARNLDKPIYLEGALDEAAIFNDIIQHESGRFQPHVPVQGPPGVKILERAYVEMMKKYPQGEYRPDHINTGSATEVMRHMFGDNIAVMEISKHPEHGHEGLNGGQYSWMDPEVGGDGEGLVQHWLDEEAEGDLATQFKVMLQRSEIEGRPLILTARPVTRPPHEKYRRSNPEAHGVKIGPHEFMGSHIYSITGYNPELEAVQLVDPYQRVPGMFVVPLKDVIETFTINGVRL